MIVSKVQIQCNNIKDWNSFHDEFDRVFGFPDFYGRNMNAWIDCMTYLDDLDSEMTKIHCITGQVIALELLGSDKFKKRYSELFDAIVECSEFVNQRRIEVGESAILALSLE